MTESGKLYDASYYRSHCGDTPYERTPEWRTFFAGIAERIQQDFAPKSSLDAGCASGMLVEALLERGVDAYGFDISEYAVAQMPVNSAAHVKVGSILDSDVMDRHFDVVICIEVVEHLQPGEADAAIRNLCAWGDVVVFSSTPDVYDEPTHFNVQKPGYWAEKFAQNGFVHVLDYDATYISLWAQVYRRESAIPVVRVRQYENLLWQRTQEDRSLRDMVIKLERDTADIQWYRQEFERLAGLVNSRDLQFLENAEAQQRLQARIAELEAEIVGLQQQSADRDRAAARAGAEIASFQQQKAELWRELAEQQRVTIDQAVQLQAMERLQRQVAELEQQNQQLQSRVDELYAIAVHHEHSVQERDQTIHLMQDTRGWRMLMSWWTFKQRVTLSADKRLRAKQLARTARLTLRTEGVGGFADRSVRWLRGERRFYRKEAQGAVVPVAKPSAPAAQPTVSAAQVYDADKPFAEYDQWIAEQEPDAKELARLAEAAQKFAYQPVISVITPVYNTDRSMLIDMIESVRAQIYPHWELCLADGGSVQPHVWEVLEQYAARDPRIKVRRLEQNLGISGNSNAALELAGGEFVALLDHDDLLAPFALYAVAERLNANPDLDFLYSDKDLVTQDGRQRFHPFFKPDWSPDVLLNTNYLTHLCVIRTTLVREVGGFDPKANGAQDWALFLNVALRTDKVAHIPQVLYHWRQHPLSVATGTIDVKPYAADAQIYSIQQYLDARGLKGQPDFAEGSLIRVYWTVDPALAVSVILDVTSDLPLAQIEQRVRQYLFRSVYPKFDLIILDRSGRSAALRELRLLADPRVQILDFDPSVTTGFTRNRAVERAKGDLLVFLNADLVSESDDVIRELVGWARYPGDRCRDRASHAAGRHAGARRVHPQSGGRGRLDWTRLSQVFRNPLRAVPVVSQSLGGQRRLLRHPARSTGAGGRLRRSL